MIMQLAVLHHKFVGTAVLMSVPAAGMPSDLPTAPTGALITTSALVNMLGKDTGGSGP